MYTVHLYPINKTNCEQNSIYLIDRQHVRDFDLKSVSDFEDYFKSILDK